MFFYPLLHLKIGFTHLAKPQGLGLLTKSNRTPIIIRKNHHWSSSGFWMKDTLARAVKGITIDQRKVLHFLSL